MRATGQRAATGETRPDWRHNLEADIGEDPARYLDHNLAAGDGRELALARIRGIDRIEAVRAWRAAERRLAKRDDRQPRKGIIDRLQQRETVLEENGERPRDLRRALQEDPESVPDRYWPSRELDADPDRVVHVGGDPEDPPPKTPDRHAVTRLAEGAARHYHYITKAKPFLEAAPANGGGGA